MSILIDEDYRGLLPRVIGSDPHPLPTHTVSVDFEKLVERSVAVALGEARLAAIDAIKSVSTTERRHQSYGMQDRGPDAVKEEILSAVEAVFK
ncbi:hypothetical protein ISF9_040 [Microbacterium phage vB_MoxS-ISF9]|uniref:Uncharacterized protein n=1 Tax=Microbacterium phage vB_MoxS-ISF9 TaxID=1458670 RepID=W8NNK4_9CAUD|nr:hypothetical protein ISF9_040 [Microbacterium phage vB_MoxS-ISF9]AHL18510.1 hypothetical protein ISF9_040 [Microbacterium phage vB_MoxS-ISF9]